MQLADLDQNEHFIYNKSEWIKLKKIPRHDNTFDCLNVKQQRHTPFKGTVDVEPTQQRLEGDI